MEAIWKIFVIAIVCQKCNAATTTLGFLPHLVAANAGYSNNANSKAAIPTKVYITKNTRKLEDFVTRPLLQAESYGTPSIDSILYTSYAPPPSGLVAYKNQNLPLSINVAKIPNALAKIDFTRYPGFYATANGKGEGNKSLEQSLGENVGELNDSLARPNRTIEAAKILASSLLKASGIVHTGGDHKSSLQIANATTDVYIVKAQRKAFTIPMQSDELFRSSAYGQGYLPTLRNQFDKAYTINQFIFIIKPEKINFLNKLV